MTTESKQLEKQQPGEAELTQDRPVYVPAADIYEKEDAILVQCDMPGVDEANVEVTLEDNVLTLTGRQQDKAPEGYGLVAAEYGTGIFRRSFTVSNQIDNEKIKARMKHGVLSLELPKAKAAQPRKIKISTED